MTSKIASTRPSPDDNPPPVVNTSQDIRAFRMQLADQLSSKLVSATEMHFAKVIFQEIFTDDPELPLTVHVCGLNPADFHLELPPRLRLVVFKPVGTDRIAPEHYIAVRNVGLTISVPLENIRAFQWVRDSEQDAYFDALCAGKYQ